MAQNRAPRANSTRKEDTRPSDAWVPASTLPEPDPQDGWGFRWIRTSMVGSADNTNVSRRFREGWTPCKAEDHPELKVLSDLESRFDGSIEVGGLLLCKMPQERLEARRKHFESVAANQMEGVDRNFMRENDARMPLLATERQTDVRFGEG